MRLVPLGLLAVVLATALGAPSPAVADAPQRTVTSVPVGRPASCRLAHDRSAFFAAPHAVVAQGDTLLVAETGAHRIVRITADGTVGVLAGGVEGAADGVGEAAQFDTPTDVDVAPVGPVFVADAGNDRIRRVTATGTVRTYAGSVQGHRDGAASVAQFSSPTGVAVTPDGVVFVADNANHVIRRIATDRGVTTYAGQPGVAGKRNGPRTEARFRNPSRLRYDPSDGALYVADTGNHRIRRIDADGTVSTYAGSSRGYVDAVGKTAQFDKPTGLAVGDGTVYVADQDNDVIRRIAPDRTVTTYAGSVRGFVDGPAGAARFAAPKGATLLPDGELAVADRDNRAIRSVRSCTATATTVVATTGSTAIDATGAVTPDRSGHRVRVTLEREVDGAFVEVHHVEPLLSSSSTFTVRFERPAVGSCRVVATYLGDRRHLESRATDPTAC